MATHRPGARERLLASAEALFTRDGIRAVGVDRVCAEAGVSKRSLYQHFSGKDELVTAVVQAKADTFRTASAATAQPPRDRILAVFDRQETATGGPDFRGCPFVSAATELKDPAHPASLLARAQKVGLTDYLADAATEAGATEPALLAEQLTLVFDGASAWGVVRGGSTPATRRTVELLLAAHGL